MNSKRVMAMMAVSALSLVCLQCFAADGGDADGHINKGVSYDVRLGYNIGGVMPVGMPEEIRGLNSYKLRFNPQVACYVDVPLSNRFALVSGLKIDRKAMKTDARVKSYSMKMTRGGESVEGLFTGDVVTECSLWGVSLPVYGACSLGSSVQLRLGPYLTVLFAKEFGGHAYNGYLRKESPVGERVEIGNTPTTWGDYDFDDNLRTVQFGADLGLDWTIGKGFGAYVDLQWGLTEAFESSFKTIRQKMFPIFGTIGIFKTL